MKKAVIWIFIAAIVIFAITWGVMGLSLASGDYDVATEAYIGLVCIVLILACAVYRLLSEKCPHCGKLRLGNGKYCSHCGKKME